MASQSAPKDKNTQPNFQWTPEMIDHLIISLKDYKAEMDYKNVDFNSDVVAMYSKLRECMALAFDTECFGPIDIPVQIKLRSSLSTRTLFHSQPGLRVADPGRRELPSTRVRVNTIKILPPVVC